MTQSNCHDEGHLNQMIIRGLDAGPVPPRVQARLDETYASLGSIPQDGSTCGIPEDNALPNQAKVKHAAHSGGAGRTVRRGVLVAVAAVLTVLLCGSAFAASRLLQMQSGDAAFFQNGENLSVYDSLQEGVSSLNADVGQTVTVDGVSITLDNVSCDRSIVNLFFTLEKEGGFDLDSVSNYEGSQENEWTRLQRLAPRFSYTLVSNGEAVGTGSANVLDAYREDGKIKCMQRIVPEATLPDQVDVELNGVSFLLSDQLDGGQVESAFTFDVGMDLSTVEQPRELGSHDLVFPTSEGDKTVGMQRFTASDLGTVMVVRNDNVWAGEPLSAGSTYGPADGVLSPSMLKVTDDQGNVLTPVGAGDGSGMNPDEAQIIEFANLSSQATSVTFTPMLATLDGESASVEERKALLESNEQSVDVSHVGTKLAMSEYGGYELTGWDVSDGTVSLSLRPYGWLPDTYVELIPQQEVTNLYSDWTNLETGETGVGAHSAIRYMKNDYRTGERVQMDSYYAATDEELRGLTQYSYRSSFGAYREEADAAAILAFN